MTEQTIPGHDDLSALCEKYCLANYVTLLKDPIPGIGVVLDRLSEETLLMVLRDHVYKRYGANVTQYANERAVKILLKAGLCESVPDFDGSRLVLKIEPLRITPELLKELKELKKKEGRPK